MKYTTEDGDTIELNASEIEVEEGDDLRQIPGVKSEINSASAATRRSVEQNLKSKLKDDDDYFAEAARQRGIELRDDGRPKGTAAKQDLKELKQELAKAKAKAEKADSYKEELTSLRETKLENQLLQHADGVKDDLKDLFLQSAKSNFVYDEASGEYVPAGDGDYPDHTRTTKDVVQSILEKRPSLAKNRSAQNGPGDTPGSGGSGEGRTYTMQEAKDIATKARKGDKQAQKQLADVKKAAQEDRITE